MRSRFSESFFFFFSIRWRKQEEGSRIRTKVALQWSFLLSLSPRSMSRPHFTFPPNIIITYLFVCLFYRIRFRQLNSAASVNYLMNSQIAFGFAPGTNLPARSIWTFIKTINIIIIQKLDLQYLINCVNWSRTSFTTNIMRCWGQ